MSIFRIIVPGCLEEALGQMVKKASVVALETGRYLRKAVLSSFPFPSF
jgi:hypothetical protein